MTVKIIHTKKWNQTSGTCKWYNPWFFFLFPFFLFLFYIHTNLPSERFWVAWLREAKTWNVYTGDFMSDYLSGSKQVTLVHAIIHYVLHLIKTGFSPTHTHLLFTNPFLFFPTISVCQSTLKLVLTALLQITLLVTKTSVTAPYVMGEREINRPLEKKLVVLFSANYINIVFHVHFFILGIHHFNFTHRWRVVRYEATDPILQFFIKTSINTLFHTWIYCKSKKVAS